MLNILIIYIYIYINLLRNQVNNHVEFRNPLDTSYYLALLNPYAPGVPQWNLGLSAISLS
jgi:hypothetical protein